MPTVVSKMDEAAGVDLLSSFKKDDVLRFDRYDGWVQSMSLSRDLKEIKKLDLKSSNRVFKVLVTAHTVVKGEGSLTEVRVVCN
jgi:hypothetical protein